MYTKHSRCCILTDNNDLQTRIEEIIGLYMNVCFPVTISNVVFSITSSAISSAVFSITSSTISSAAFSITSSTISSAL